MKSYGQIIGVLLLFFFIGCKEDQPEKEESIYGTWQYVEFHIAFNAKGESSFYPVEDGYFLKIESGGYLKTTQLIADCSDGSRIMEGNYSLDTMYEVPSIHIEYTCSQESNQYKDDFLIRFRDDRMELVPIYDLCDEGCSYLFKKVSDIQIGD